MARVRKKKVAVVQCLGGCVRQTAAQTADTEGAVTDGKQEKEKNQSQAGTNCQQMIETELITTSCEWGCLGGGSCVEACRLEESTSMTEALPKWIRRNAQGADYVKKPVPAV